MAQAHPDVQKKLDALEALNLTPYSELTPDGVREQSWSLVKGLPDPEGVSGVTTEDFHTDESNILMRRYCPPDGSGETVLVYYHGGGYVVGSVEYSDRFVRLLTQVTGFTVISVDYRLAPEFPFPTPVDDGYEALCWIDAHRTELGIDQATRLIVAGDSAGGHLAAMVSILSRDRHGPKIDLQWLIYPWVDDNHGRPSCYEYAEGYWLTREKMIWFADHFVHGNHKAGYPQYPLHVKDLSNLPPAYVVLAECDVLFDEGLEYAQSLQSAGVNVVQDIGRGMIHGFITDYLTPEPARLARQFMQKLGTL